MRSIPGDDTSAPEADLERQSSYNPHHSYPSEIITIAIDPAELRAAEEREMKRRAQREAKEREHVQEEKR